MSLIQKITPVNLLEEKQKFLANPDYDPQFIYRENLPKETLYRYGLPKQELLVLAEAIVAQAYANRNEADLLMMDGVVMEEHTVNSKITSFLEMHKLAERYEVLWSSSFVSRASITKDTIKLRVGSEFRKDDLLGMLYHEIGTHALRRINYEQQPWFGKKTEYGFKNYLRTEEGLASLHSLLPKSYKSAHKTALRYLAVNFAQNHSFSELWKFLGKYVQDIETRWMITIRQKRGMEDTSQPGGFSKDLVYFEGMVELAHWLQKHNFDLESLYFGKLAVEDVEKARSMNPDFQPTLPSFYTLDVENYKKNILEIIKENQLTRV